MPRKRSAERERARELWEADRSRTLVSIAEELNVPENRIRKWKCEDQWEHPEMGALRKVKRERERSEKNTELQLVASVEKNETLNDRQRAFCLYYVKSFNATQAYVKAYGCNYAYAGRIADLYVEAFSQIEVDMKALLDRFMEQGNLTPEEARKYLAEPVTKKQRDLLMQKLNEIEDPDIRRKLLARINSGSYAVRAKRLRVLQDNIRIECAKVAQRQISVQTEAMRSTGEQSYYRTIFDIEQGAGYAADFAKVSISSIDSMLAEKYEGKSFSDRVWNDTQVMADHLGQIIQTNVTTGRSWGRCIDEVQRFSASQGQGGLYSALRLLRTETASVMNEMSAQASEELGAARYRFIAVIDFRTSELCRAHDGLIDPDTHRPYTYKKRKRGVNFPPLHPWCRSCEAPIMDSSTLEGLKRKALDPKTGELMDIDASMTYKQWYKEYVQKDPEAQLSEKMVQHTAQDRVQWRQYRDVLGKEAPKTLADFQRLKYTDTEQWDALKATYRDVNWMRRAQANGIERGSVHRSPSEFTPNTVFDRTNANTGKVISRRYFGRTGKPRLDIDLTDHGNPAEHKIVPHYHGWKELAEGKIHREKDDLPLTLSHRIANADILKGD